MLALKQFPWHPGLGFLSQDVFYEMVSAGPSGYAQSSDLQRQTKSDDHSLR